MGMMAKSLSCLPLDTVGSGAQIQMGRKHSGTIVDTHCSEVQLSHVNNEKNGARTPVSMQIWNSQRSPERQLYWHLKLNLSLRLLLLWVLHCFCFVCVLTWSAFRFLLRKKNDGKGGREKTEQKLVKYLMLLLYAGPERCLVHDKEHGLSQTFCIHEDSKCVWR